MFRNRIEDAFSVISLANHRSLPVWHFQYKLEDLPPELDLSLLASLQCFTKVVCGMVE